MLDVLPITQLLEKISDLLGFEVSLELIAAFVLVLSCLIFFSLSLRKRNTSRRHARQRKRIAKELLLKAIDQRSTLEISFASEEMQGRVLSGACSSIEDDDVVIVDVELTHSLQTWIGEYVDVSFKLQYKDIANYYRFPSEILGMRDGRQAISIELAQPPHILPAQKRDFIRITPMPDHILGIGLWSLEPGQPLPLDSTKLDSASLSYRPGKLAQCSLLNLSAGGLRMEVPHALQRQLSAALTLESQLLCLLLLRAPDSDHLMPFWLACRIVSLAEDPKTHNVIISVKFKAWALSDTGSSGIAWFPAGKSGEVTPLASWVLRHHLGQGRRRE